MTPADPRPWRHLCLRTDRPGTDQGVECQLPLGHDGLHDWDDPRQMAAEIAAKHGILIRERVA